ncbi:Camk protein kinase, partial [Globisporangium splendens]
MGLVPRYELLESLQTSMFGEILLCLDTQTQDEVVVKTIDLSLALSQKSNKHERVQENVLKEIEVLSQLCAIGGHPNVITMRDYFVMPKGENHNVLHVVMDYCEGGDLLESCAQQQRQKEPDQAPPNSGNSVEDLSEARSSSRVEEHIALGYLRDVLAGLRFLHGNGIAHRDLSLENILLRDGRAVITDFGLCVQQEGIPHGSFVASGIVGKHYYMAPEVICDAHYDPRGADIWSLGVSYFILVTSSPPFEMASMKDSGFQFVAKHGIKAVLKAWGLADTISEASQDLLERMLHVDPRLRITMNELVRHPAITNFPVSPVSSCDAL